MRNMKNGNFLIKLGGGHRRLLTIALVAILAVSTFMFALPNTSLKAKAAGNDLISNAACSGSYTFSTSNSDSYFVNQATYAAYKAPANNSDGDAQAQGMADLISGVFDHTFTGDMGYKYANGTISLYTKFANLTDENFTSSTVEQNKADITQTLINQDFLQFPGLNAEINTYVTSGGQLSNLKYSYYDNGSIKLTEIIITDTGNIANLDEGDILSMLAKFNSGYTIGNNNASYIDYADIAEVAGSTANAVNTNLRVFTQDEIDAAIVIKDEIDASVRLDVSTADMLSSTFRLISISGDDGLISHVTKSTEYQRQAVWSSSSYANGFSLSSSAPTYIFANTNEYAKSYFVPGNSLTGNFSGSDTGRVNFLKAVFPAATSMAFNSSTSYSMSISQTGRLTLVGPQTHSTPAPSHNTNEEYSEPETTPTPVLVTPTPKPNHVHSYTKETVTKEATCTEDGELTKKCSCGATRKQTIPALEHQWVLDKTVEASCGSDGYNEYVCSRCGETYREEIPSLGAHKWELNETIPATCGVDGKKIYKCSVCGETKEEVIKATGHVPSNWKVVKEAGSFSNGEKQVVCTVCGEIIETESIPAVQDWRVILVCCGVSCVCSSVVASIMTLVITNLKSAKKVIL